MSREEYEDLKKYYNSVLSVAPGTVAVSNGTTGVHWGTTTVTITPPGVQMTTTAKPKQYLVHYMFQLLNLSKDAAPSPKDRVVFSQTDFIVVRAIDTNGTCGLRELTQTLLMVYAKEIGALNKAAEDLTPFVTIIAKHQLED